MAIFQALKLPEPALEERALSQVCDWYVDGVCNDGNCMQSHEICRIQGLTPSIHLGAMPNSLSMAPRGRASGNIVFDSDGPGSLSLAGPRHDNDHVLIRDIHILPTTDEILSLRPPYMPKTSASEPVYLPQGMARKVDQCFRQLRYDNTNGIVDMTYHAMQQITVEQVNDGYSDYEYSRETPSGARYLRFRKVAFEELSFSESNSLIVRLSFECPKELRGLAMHKKKIFEKGMLVGLVGMNKETKEVFTTFFQTHLRESTEAMYRITKNHERASIQLNFAEPDDTDAVRKIMYHVHGLLTASFALVELGNVLLAGFVPQLKSLQKLADWPSVAFENYVAPNPTAQTLFPPTYTMRDGFEYDLSVLRAENIDPTNNATMKLRPMANSLVDPHAGDALQMITSCTTLDKGQAMSLYETLSRGLAFTQGPPGTGKSFLGVALARVILASRTKDDTRPILVICQTNHALDSFLTDIVKQGITDIARIGNGCKDELIQQFDYRRHSQKLETAPKDRYHQAIRKGQLLALEADGLGWAESLTKSELGWCPVRDHLRVHHYAEYRQLNIQLAGGVQTCKRSIRYGGFVYEFWAEGGDIENMEQLLAAADTLLGSCELKHESDPSIAAKFKERLLETIKSNAVKVTSKTDPIWSLSTPERHALISQWNKEMNHWKLCDAITEVHRRHHAARNRMYEAYHKHDVRALQPLKVIGLTTSGLARHFKLIEQLEPHVAVVEEAGEVLEAHTLIALALPLIDHYISIGDPQQLKPHINELTLSSENQNGLPYSLDVSLHGRMQETIPSSRLTIQRRMHPDIAALSRATLYPFLEDHESTLLRPPVSGMADRIYFMDHRNSEDRPDPRGAMGKSYQNIWEVQMIANFVQYLIGVGGYALGQIAVITPYNGQLAAITSNLQQSCSIWLSDADKDELIANGQLSPENLKSFEKTEVNLGSMLRVATIDNFQGEEADIIIFSAVRSNDNGKRGFLEIKNRINVACSRARHGFYVIGNSKLLRGFPMWEDISKVFEEQGKIGPAFRACCSRHQDNIFEIKEPEQFENMPSCSHLCLEQLPCGHVCKRPCHTLSEHDVMPCLEECKQVHPCGHQCSKICGLPCGDCTFESPSVELDCGHLFHPTCSDLAHGPDFKCKFPIEHKRLDCGHSQDVICSSRDELLICEQSCGVKLQCGHHCLSDCKDCQKISGHPKCDNKCGRELKCGHTCQEECGHFDSCPPCQAPCERSCEHGQCEEVCSFVCDPCVQICTWECSQQGTCQSVCCLASFQRDASAGQIATLPDTIDRLLAQSGLKLDQFTDEIYLKEGSLRPSFASFRMKINRNCGPLTCQRDYDLVKERGTWFEDVQSKVIRFRDRVVIPVQDALAALMPSHSSAALVLPFKLRFDFLHHRCRFLTLDEGIRVVLYLEEQQDGRAEPVEHISVMIHALKLKIGTEAAANVLGICSKIADCKASNLKRLEVEFHLTQIHFYMIAQLYGCVDDIPDYNVMDSLKRVTELCEAFPYTAAIFLELAHSLTRYYQGGSAPDHPVAWNTHQVRELSRKWGIHEIGHLKTCQYQHPYSSKTFGSCPECGQQASNPSPTIHAVNYRGPLATDSAAFMAAMSTKKSKNYGSPKGTKK